MFHELTDWSQYQCREDRKVEGMISSVPYESQEEFPQRITQPSKDTNTNATLSILIHAHTHKHVMHPYNYRNYNIINYIVLISS